MMDSHDTNLPLEQGKLEEEKNVNEVAESQAHTTSEIETVEPNQAANTPKTSKEEIIERLREIAADAENANKQEVDALKQNFYKLHKALQENAKKVFVEGGGAPEDFRYEPDGTEETLKSLLGVIKEKRNALMEAQEKEKEKNLAIKLSIIEKMKELVAHPEEANNSYNEFKQLQQQWNEIKLIPASQVNDLWKSYQLYSEKFYDIIKLNNEFREYDFKKNLEIKTSLCEAAEKLAEETDVISAFHQLQKLHQEFRETGPVAKELREEIWNRFKAASTIINRRHQQHFEDLKEQEQHNLDAKTAICEIMEAIEYPELTTFAAWEEKTKEVIALQAKWKTIGFASPKANVKIFERFRASCDLFFQKKGEFYKQIKENLNANLEKKKALCEKAEQLKDSTDWKATSEVLTQIQKEWKAIGAVPKKHSDAIWKRFISACDYFFEQKGKATSSQRSEELVNLEKKEELIRQLKELNENMEAEEAREQIRAIMQQWNSIGYVPFKEKDKIYKQYRELIDKHFDRLHISISDRRLNDFKSSISKSSTSTNGKGDNLYREREKLVRAYEAMKNDIQTYENNLGFLNASSKKGNSLVNEITRKIEKLKDELTLIQKKIDVIDNSMNEK